MSYLKGPKGYFPGCMKYEPISSVDLGREEYLFRDQALKAACMGMLLSLLIRISMGRSTDERSAQLTVCLLLLVRDHLLNVGDVLLDECDLLGPGLMVRIGVWFSGSISSFRFGKAGRQVFQFLFERRAGHMRKGITRAT
jgi:hypothetical protein